MMSSEWISAADVAYFQRRYEKTWRHVLDYAVKTANAYAEQHAPPCVRHMVAQLHLRYSMQTDPGDRKLIRRAIDEAIAYGEYCIAHAKS